jgi:D-glycero-D-manno-heptose 1,7-bisphosphate phosphatase
MEDPGYPSRPDQVRLVPGAAAALHALHDEGFLLAVVSNQSGIGRGLVTPEQAADVHARFMRDLADAGVALDDARYCPHAPDGGCVCRKPAPGLILESAAALGVDPANCFMVGNSQSDIAAGKSAGCRTIAFGALQNSGADWTAPTWPDVVDVILRETVAV